MPTYGTGSMAGIPITDTQGFCIPTDAKNPASAAAFLEYMQSPERVNAMWTTSRALPAERDVRRVADRRPVPDERLRDLVGRRRTTSYVADLMPTLFWTDAMFVISPEDPRGRDDRGGVRAERAGGHREVGSAEPRLVENYTTWAQDLAARQYDGRRRADPGPAVLKTRPWMPYLYVLPALLLIGFVFAYPVARVVDFSFRLIRGNSGPFVGLDNYGSIFDDPTFAAAAKHSALLLLAVPVLLAISVLVAVFLYERVARLEDLPQRPLLPVHPRRPDRRDRRQLHVHAQRRRQLRSRRRRDRRARTGSATATSRCGRSCS